MSIKVHIDCHLQENRLIELTSFLKDNLANVRSFEGCLSVAVCFSPDKSKMLLAEEWRSIEDHQRYIQFISGNGVFQSLIAFFQTEPTVNYFSETDL